MPRLARVIVFVLIGALTACGGLRLGSRPPQTSDASRPGSTTGANPASNQPGARPDGEPAVNVVDFTRRLGLIAHGSPLPFSGTVTYLASATDSTNALVAFSLPPSALVFRRESDLHRADYRVAVTVRRGDASVARVEALEAVRVASVREAGSSENSIIFQQLLTLAPGNYTLTVNVTDEASAKKGMAEVAMRVPAFAAGSVSKPAAFFEITPRTSRDSVPRIVSNPRATFTYARDSTIDMYVEAYGVRPSSRLGVAVQVESVTVWTDSVEVRNGDERISPAVVRVPLTRFAPGLAYFATWIPGTTDTVKTPFFVSYGEPVPATTFADMIGYLRFFASDTRLKALSAASPPGRGLAWANFYRETDPNPGTPPNELLGAYLERLRYVEAQFAEGATPGWRTDRGMVYLLFGQYDQAIDPFGSSVGGERGRSLQWEYRSLNLSVEFMRVGSFGQWRLTPASEQNVRSAARRQLGGDILR